MDVRARKTKGTIKIGVIEIHSNGKENAIRPFDMPRHENTHNHNHADNVIKKIRERVPNAEIYLVPFGYKGIKYLVDKNVSIVNMSIKIHITPSILLELAKKTFIVKSAGNDGDKGEVGFARAGVACIVGAVDPNMNPRTYSSWGNGAVTTTAESGYIIDGYRFNGTSAAAPNLTGLLAQWYIWYNQNIGIYPSIQATNQFIRQNSHDIWEDGKDLQTGWGLFRLPHRFEATKIIIEPDNQMAKKIKYVEGEKPVESEIDLLVKPTVIDQRILIPLRGVNEGLGLTVDWINRQAIVIG